MYSLQSLCIDTCINNNFRTGSNIDKYIDDKQRKLIKLYTAKINNICRSFEAAPYEKNNTLVSWRDNLIKYLQLLRLVGGDSSKCVYFNSKIIPDLNSEIKSNMAIQRKRNLRQMKTKRHPEDTFLDGSFIQSI